jgi:hypothetical protein
MHIRDTYIEDLILIQGQIVIMLKLSDNFGIVWQLAPTTDTSLKVKCSNNGNKSHEGEVQPARRVSGMSNILHNGQYLTLYLCTDFKVVETYLPGLFIFQCSECFPVKPFVSKNCNTSF